MTYRNATYVAFHAEGSTDPTASDIRFYRLLKAWSVRDENDFRLIDSHEKTAAVRDSSKRETLRRSLVSRLLSSKNMILIVGKTTRQDTDWVPFEISYAVDDCKIPIIAAYPDYEYIADPGKLSHLWPSALKQRIDGGSAHVIHVPFKMEPLKDAVGQFHHDTYPNGGGLGCYSDDAYRSWGLLPR